VPLPDKGKSSQNAPEAVVSIAAVRRVLRYSPSLSNTSCPLDRGGTIALDNLALACQGCNNYKYTKTEGRDPVSGDSVSLYHPRQQRWRDHFAWNDDFTLVIGLTPTGRATVKALQLNREGLVNLRRVLYSMGEHPPAEPAQDEK
jgi:hypothetical protein